MAKKTTEQQFEERLKELRGELGSEEDKLEKLEKAYAKEVSILEGQELEDFEEKWDAASKKYKDKGTAEDADEVLKLALEKIKILSEIILYTDEA